MAPFTDFATIYNDTNLAGMTESQFYRRRFESSVLGNHCMMPSLKTSEYVQSVQDAPSGSGANVNFHDPTPMPFRFQAGSLKSHNKRHELTKPENPSFSTTSSEIGKLSLMESDLHMRWYGKRGGWTKWHSVQLNDGQGVDPKTRINAGLNTAMDRSDIHDSFDQGWNGRLGLYDYNLPNMQYASFVAKGVFNSQRPRAQSAPIRREPMMGQARPKKGLKDTLN